MHTRLFFGMLWRSPALLWNKTTWISIGQQSLKQERFLACVSYYVLQIIWPQRLPSTSCARHSVFLF